MPYVNAYVENFQPEVKQAGALKTKLGIAALATTAPTAGGSATPALSIGNSTSPNVYFGSGAPTISATQGSFYLNSTGSSTSTRAYINSSAGSGTTWTAITTAG